MIKLFIPAAASILLAFGFISNNDDKAIPEKSADAREDYEQFCSSCHGTKVEAFVDRKWKHGNEVSDLIKSIKNGYPNQGMPAWETVLSEKQIEDLAVLINKSLETVDQYKFDDKPKNPVFTSSEQTVRLDTVATGIEVPWGMTFLPGGDMLITNRGGELFWVKKGGSKTSIKGVPSVVAEGQGGLLDVAVDPNYEKNGWLYISYSKGKKIEGKDLTTTAVVRGKIKNGEFTESNEIFEALPYFGTRHHYGSRLQFDKKGFLFISVGDRGQTYDGPQTLEKANGKIHRINSDGSIPKDNPFVGKGKAVASIYSYGQRNPQGMAMNPTTGEIWEHEHGPRGGDEVNVIKKGANFGWPEITYGINYDGKVISTETKNEGMEQPELYWLPSIAPSGMAFVEGANYPKWKGDLMVGSLRFNYLNRCIIKNNKIVKEEKLLPNVGRMRMVEMGPDGYLYIGVENPGYVFRLIPM